MKFSFSLVVTASLVVMSWEGFAYAAPVEALPSTVRASLPQGATSFLLKRLPIGDKGSPCLVHVWGAVRPNTPDSTNSYNPYLPSPFCVDVFESRSNAQKLGEWRLVASTSYTAGISPTSITSHWLHPRGKRGPILEIISSNGAPGVSTKHTLFVWDKGLRAQDTPPAPQTFWSGGTGGGLITLSFGVISGDTTAVKVSNFYEGKAVSSTNYRWNGEMFTAHRVPR